MDTVDNTSETVKARATPYVAVNNEWPDEMPTPTPQEAVAAARQLYRIVFKRPFRGKVTITSGRRHTWLYGGIEMTVNPNKTRGYHGWKALVHDLSHAFFRRLHPSFSDHDWRHAQLEKMMIAEVIARGWLQGRLRRPEKAKPDLAQVRHARILARIAAWQRKAKRAATALKKLRRQQAYYERKVSS